MSESLYVVQPKLLSILVHSSGKKRELEQTIESLLAAIGTLPENGQSIEIIVGDNASTDGSADHVLSVFGGPISTGQLRILDFDYSMSLPNHFFRTLEKAQGAWVAWVQAGELWSKDSIRHILDYLNEYDLVIGWQLDAPKESVQEIILELSHRPVNLLLVRRSTLTLPAQGRFAISKISYGLRDLRLQICLNQFFNLIKKGKIERVKFIQSSPWISRSHSLPPEMELSIQKLQQWRRTYTFVTNVFQLPLNVVKPMFSQTAIQLKFEVRRRLKR